MSLILTTSPKGSVLPSTSPVSPEELKQDQAPGLYALFTIFLVLPLAAVALRIAARRLARLPLWWDDWLLVLACACVVAQFIFLMEAIANGEGQHVEAVSLNNVKTYLMWTYASEIYYAITVTLVKCSVLCLYLRLFGIKPMFVRICYGLLLFVGLWGITILLSTIFQCTPIAAAWDVSIRSSQDTQCINLRAWLIGDNVPNILADVVITLLPLPLIWKLKMSWLRKLGLSMIFLLAFATTIISIIRVVANASIDITDPTWGYVATAQYSTIEANTGVLTACLPVLLPLLRYCTGCNPISTDRSATADLGNASVPASHQTKLARSHIASEEDQDNMPFHHLSQTRSSDQHHQLTGTEKLIANVKVSRHSHNTASSRSANRAREPDDRSK